MEKISFACPSCSNELAVANHNAGGKFRCPNCYFQGPIPTDNGNGLHSDKADVEEDRSTTFGSDLEELPEPTDVHEPIQFDRGLIDRAELNDTEAVVTLFRQFVPEDERVYFAEYLGKNGIMGFGSRSFSCLTDKRVASLRVSGGGVHYEDGLLEHVTGGTVYQPSKLVLNFLIVATLLLAIPTFGLGLLLLPISGRTFYRIVRSGLVVRLRDGESVWVFVNRKLLGRAAHLYQACIRAREERLSLLAA